eukprot:8409960-Ditylum_brightwellii.AAC.1
MRGGHGINESTAYHWMCALVYKYNEQYKYYYVGAYEQEDVTRYRSSYTTYGLNGNTSVFRKDKQGKH